MAEKLNQKENFLKGIENYDCIGVENLTDCRLITDSQTI